jgi:hypothetical protein
MRIDDLVYRLATSLPRHRKKLLFSLLGSLLAAYYYNKSCQQAAAKEDKELVVVIPDKKNSSKTKPVGVNAAFYNQLKRLLPICVPGKGEGKDIYYAKTLLLQESLQRNLLFWPAWRGF